MTKINRAILDGLKPAAKSYRMAAGGQPGLFLEVLPSGLKKWRLRARAMGRSMQATLGSFPELGLLAAREKAAKLLEEGPLNPNRAQKICSFGDLSCAWLGHNGDKRWSTGFRHTISLLKSNILPSLGRQSLGDISPSTIVLDLLKPLVERGGIDLANSALKVCRLIFRFGLSQGHLESDPTDSLPEFDSKTITCQIVPNIDPNVAPSLDPVGLAYPRVNHATAEHRHPEKAHHYHVKRNPLLLTNFLSQPQTGKR
jgi:hypothetical protein